MHIFKQVASVFILYGLSSFPAHAQFNEIPESCQFKDVSFPENMAVYGAAGYSGKETDFQIDQSGDNATTMNIVVNEPNKPVALILGAYEPAIWNLSYTPETKISAVLLSGYNRQIISGLPDNVPVLISYYTAGNNEANPDAPCGEIFLNSEDIENFNPVARHVFGKPVDKLYPASEEGDVVVGDSQYDPSTLIITDINFKDTYMDKNQPLAGLAGLEDALKKGKIRKATEKDLDTWNNAIKNDPTKNKDIPPIAGVDGENVEYHKNTIGDSSSLYVVLEDFTYPAGLYGSYSVSFLIPKGVKKPDGNPGHSNVYNMNDMSCSDIINCSN